MTAIQLIKTERQRQVGKGLGDAGDDLYVDKELAQAASWLLDDYVSPGMAAESADDRRAMLIEEGKDGWPATEATHHYIKYWDRPIDLLTVAAALIAAEIERLQRLQAKEAERARVDSTSPAPDQ